MALSHQECINFLDFVKDDSYLTDFLAYMIAELNKHGWIDFQFSREEKKKIRIAMRDYEFMLEESL